MYGVNCAKKTISCQGQYVIKGQHMAAFLAQRIIGHGILVQGALLIDVGRFRPLTMDTRLLSVTR